MQWPRDYADLLAKAQHYGMPTRLLDFTERGLVAAYFAAQQPPQPKSRDIAIWALDTDVLRYGDRCNGTWFDLLRAGRAANPNLHAQAGVFVVWVAEGQVMPFDRIVGRLASGKIKLGSGKLHMPRPAFHKLLLPRKAALDLLRLLVDERVTGADLFPGPEGVVRSMREQGVHKRFTHLFERFPSP